MSSSSEPSASSISEAADALRRGGLVVFPTETVYGVGADARNAEAVERLFAAKGRPAERAVTVHLGRDPDLSIWASEVGDGVRRLAAAFWPGPLTLVLPARNDVLGAIRGGGGTVGVRVPDHPVTLELLESFGNGIAGSSANRHGEPAATTVEDARAIFGNSVDVYLDGGSCRLGEGSTVVDLSVGDPVALRIGALPLEEVESVLGKAVVTE